jgi:hypothetical protein
VQKISWPVTKKKETFQGFQDQAILFPLKSFFLSFYPLSLAMFPLLIPHFTLPNFVWAMNERTIRKRALLRLLLPSKHC